MYSAGGYDNITVLRDPVFRRGTPEQRKVDSNDVSGMFRTGERDVFQADLGKAPELKKLIP